MSRIAVIGAGLSGLAAAYRLRQRLPNSDVAVFEAGPRPGGVIRTRAEQGYTWESGPNGFLDSQPSTLDLCRDLGLGPQLITASEGSRKNRYLCLNGELVRLPGAPLSLLTTRALSLRGKRALLSEPFRKRPPATPADESVAVFARRRFGNEAAATFIDALVTGIHGGDPEQLELASAFPRLAKFEAEHGSVFRGFRAAAKARKTPVRMWSFPTGLQTLIDALAASLGPHLRLNTPVTKLEPVNGQWAIRSNGLTTMHADAVVLTPPAHVQAELLSGVDPAFASELNAIPTNSLAVVALGYKVADAPRKFDGFGYIAPQNTRRDVLGVQWCSSIFPGRAPAGHVLWRAICGGVHRGDIIDFDDPTLTLIVQREMLNVLGVCGEPKFVRVVRWRRGIPQYVVGHRARLERLDGLARKHPGLFLGGNSLRGISINDCTEQGVTLARRVGDFLDGGKP